MEPDVLHAFAILERQDLTLEGVSTRYEIRSGPGERGLIYATGDVDELLDFVRGMLGKES